MMKNLFLLLLSCFLLSNIAWSQAVGDYRSKQNGTWGTATNWETWNGSAWVIAGAAPNSTNGVITVNHTMTIAATITLDQVTVSSTGSIAVSGTPTITIADGTGDDLVNNGTVNLGTRPLTNNGQIVNNASFTTGGTITLATGSTFTNAMGATYTQTAGTININNVSTFLNQGTFNQTAGTLANSSTLNNSGSMTIAGTLNNTATTSVFSNSGSLTINGAFNMNNATASFTNTASGTVTNNGTFTFTVGSFTLNNTLINNGTFVMNGTGTVTNPNNIANQINSTFRYSANASQTVYEIPYYHLELGGSAATNNKTLTLTNNYSLSGNLTILSAALNVTFVINGAFNFNIFGITTVNINGKIEPSTNTVFNLSGNTLNLMNNGEIRVTSTNATPLSAQYQNVGTWNVQDSGIVNYYAPGAQNIQETLPDGSNYGSLYITSIGTAINKSYNITANRTIRGNLVASATTATGLLAFSGSGTIQVGGRLDITVNGVVDVPASITFQATGATPYMNVGANTQLYITQSQFTSQYQNFNFVAWNASSTAVFDSPNAQFIESVPTDGPFRSYGNVRIRGDRSTNNVTFQSTNIGIAATLRDSATYTSGDMIFGTSNIIFTNTAAFTSFSISKTFNFYNLTLSGTAQITFSDKIVVNNDFTIGNQTSLRLNVGSWGQNALEVIGNTTITQTTAGFTTPKIQFNINNLGCILNNLQLNGTASMNVIGGTTSENFAIINGSITNSNTSGGVVLTTTNTLARLVSTATNTISGNPITFSDNVFVYGDWNVTTNITLNNASQKMFSLQNANFNLNSSQLIASGTMHNLEYLPSNVTMPPATDPFCSHPQVINWNCVRAETIYVATTGNNTNSGLTPATAVRDMRVAVRKVANGGVIMVGAGTFTEIFDLKKKIKIHGNANSGASATILQAPTSGLSAPAAGCPVSQMQDSAIVYFDQGADSSTLYNCRITHNVSDIRKAVHIDNNVKGIVIDNNYFNNTYDNCFGFPCDPGYQDCPSDPTTHATRTYNIWGNTNATFDIKSNTFQGFQRRIIGFYQGGDLVSDSYIRNNTLNNTGTFVGINEQDIWIYESRNISILNNTINAATIEYLIDVSAITQAKDTVTVLIEGNTISATNPQYSSIVVKECASKGYITIKNNTIQTNSGKGGVFVHASSGVTIESNTFNPTGTAFTHIEVDNVNPISGTFISSPGVNIYGNTFNGMAGGGVWDGIAIDLKRTGGAPYPPYNYLNLNHSTLNNVFSAGCDLFLNARQNLGSIVDTIWMNQGNTFPSGLSLYKVEERITHIIDDPRGASGTEYPRPVVFIVPNNYFISNEYLASSGPANPIPIDNRSIQDGIDFATAGDTINLDFDTFTYPSSTEFESTVNFNKRLVLRSNNDMGNQPTIDRFITVNLPSVVDSVTQINNFAFSDGATQALTFQVNTGDWTLWDAVSANGGVITFASQNATLQEQPLNTIRGQKGWIQTTRTINAPSSLNVAGFGAEITTGVNLGTTTIRRGHWEQTMPSGYKSILRFYHISPTTNTGLNATLRFRYDDSEVNGLTEANLRQYRAGCNWPTVCTYALQGSTANNTTTNYVDFSPIPAFSWWTLAADAPLPVEISQFNASLINNNSVRLDWFVQNEIQLHHYEVEKSYDLNNFTTLHANIPATGASSYLAWDYQPKVGVNYYRLKMVDIDGSYKYSEVRAVVIDPNQELSMLVYPNPFNDQLTLSIAGIDNQPANITITDALGRTVFHQTFNEWNGNATLNLNKLSAGVYYLNVQIGDKQIGSKLIKN